MLGNGSRTQSAFCTQLALQTRISGRISTTPRFTTYLPKQLFSHQLAELRIENALGTKANSWSSEKHVARKPDNLEVDLCVFAPAIGRTLYTPTVAHPMRNFPTRTYAYTPSNACVLYHSYVEAIPLSIGI